MEGNEIMTKVNIIIMSSSQYTNPTVLGGKAPSETFLTRIITGLICNKLEKDPLLNVYNCPIPNLGDDIQNLKEQIRLANEWTEKQQGNTFLLNVHSDGGYDGSGASGFYASEKGKAFVTPIYEKLARHTPWGDMGCRKRDNLAVLNQTKAVAGLIELSFHDKLSEATWIFDNAHTIAGVLREGIYEGIGILSPSHRPIPSKPWRERIFDEMAEEGVLESPEYWLPRINEPITTSDAIVLSWAVIKYIKRKGGIT